MNRAFFGRFGQADDVLGNPSSPTHVISVPPRFGIGGILETVSFSGPGLNAGPPENSRNHAALTEIRAGLTDQIGQIGLTDSHGFAASMRELAGLPAPVRASCTAITEENLPAAEAFPNAVTGCLPLTQPRFCNAA